MKKCIQVWLAFMFACSIAMAQVAPAKPNARKAASPREQGQKPKFKAIWEPVNYKQDLALMDVFFVSDEEGWVTGEHGTILHTKDGGNNWTPQLGGDPHSEEQTVAAPRFLDPKHGWALQGGKLLRTTDGEGWEQIGDIPAHWGVVEYVFLSPNDGVLMDGNNNVARILRTNNAGRSWKEIMSPKDCHATIQVEGLTQDADCVLKAMHFPSPNIGYAIGGTGKDFNALFVAKTEDGGKTWNLSSLPDVGQVWIGGAWGASHNLFFTDENTGFANLNDVKLLATNNGGQSWHGLVASPAGEIRFPDREVGWIFDGQRLTFTTDGGKRWNSRNIRFPAPVKAYSFPSRQRAYAVGEHGMAYRYRVVPIDYTAKGMIDAPMMPAAEPASLPKRE